MITIFILILINFLTLLIIIIIIIITIIIITTTTITTTTIDWYRRAHSEGVFDIDSDEDKPLTGSASFEALSGIKNLNTLLSGGSGSGSGNGTNTWKRDRLNRSISDLELSSNVQKAVLQTDNRVGRYVDNNHSSDFNNAYRDFYNKHMKDGCPDPRKIGSGGNGSGGVNASPSSVMQFE